MGRSRLGVGIGQIAARGFHLRLHLPALRERCDAPVGGILRLLWPGQKFFVLVRAENHGGGEGLEEDAPAVVVTAFEGHRELGLGAGDDIRQ